MAVNDIEVVETNTALEAQMRGEIDMQIATAKRYPREISRVREKVLALATCDQKTAESCFYTIPREGKMIQGPSVRLAEIVAGSYGNIKCAARVLGIEETHVVCQAVCMDMESNYSVSVEVRRRITTKAGKRYSEDMIVTTANAGCAIAYRNAVYKVVPMAMLKDVEESIRKVGLGDERTMTDRRKAAITYFEGHGHKKEQVMALLQKRKIEDIDLGDVGILRGIIEAVKEGSTTLAEVFDRVGKSADKKDDPLSPGRHTRKSSKSSAPETHKQETEPTLKETARREASDQSAQMVEDSGDEPEPPKSYQRLYAAYDDHAREVDGCLLKVGLAALPDLVWQDMGEDDLKSLDRASAKLAKAMSE